MPASTSTAPELTAEVVQRILLTPLAAASIVLSSGVRVFDTNGGNVLRIPRLTSMETPSWHGENELIDEVDADFGELTLLPPTMKSVKSLTRFSNELARQSVVALDAALRDRMVFDVAAKLDTAFIAGDGGDPAGTEPLGLVNWTDTQSITSVGAITLDVLHDAIGKLLASNVPLQSARWLVTPFVFTALRKLKDSAGRYQLSPDPTQAGGYTLLGLPVQVTARIPTSSDTGTPTTVALWVPSMVAVARDIAPTVKILDQTYGSYDQTALRVTARFDLAPMYPESVVLLKGVTGG